MSSRAISQNTPRRRSPRWTMTCAGSFAIMDQAGADCTPRGRKARAIIVFLTSHGGSQIPREKLMELLWGDRGEAQARSSLRQALFELRSSAPGLVTSDRDHVSIPRGAIQLIGDAGEEEFFADLNHVSPPFDEWLEGERRRRTATVWSDLRNECARLLACGRGGSAISLIDHMMRLDPYNEDGVRIAMQAEFQAGHAAGIDRRFRDIADLLKRDLGVWPATETRTLRDHLLDELTRKPVDVGRQGKPEQETISQPDSDRSTSSASSKRGVWRWWLGAFVAVLLVSGALFAAWREMAPNALPVVAVAPADHSPHTLQLSRDLLVKLGTLAEVGSGRWRLVEAANFGDSPAYIFRPSESLLGSEIKANLLFLDGKDDSVLWAREFQFVRGAEGDLRQQVSLTAGRVLECALDARQHGSLPPELLRRFLTGCASSAELSETDPLDVARMMREVIAARPSFAPAWELLLQADASLMQLAPIKSAEATAMRKQFERDIETASVRAPGLVQIGLARLELLPPTAYGAKLALIERLKSQAPDNPQVRLEESALLASVGRMADSVGAARKAAELNPLSPAVSRNFIESLAWAGQTDAARRELDRASEMWAGTGALKDAQFAFHLRYGDPKLARELVDEPKGRHIDAYLSARLDPTPSTISELVASFGQLEASAGVDKTAYAVQALGEFHQKDDVFRWLQRSSVSALADMSYILFRPALADVRRDPRMMEVAKRIGLLRYWRESGRWPDFCADPKLPYRCSALSENLAAVSR